MPQVVEKPSTLIIDPTLLLERQLCKPRRGPETVVEVVCQAIEQAAEHPEAPQAQQLELRSQQARVIVDHQQDAAVTETLTSSPKRRSPHNHPAFSQHRGTSIIV